MRNDQTALNATGVLIRTGRTVVKNFTVEQRNTAAPVLYLQIFNATAPTIGTTLPNHIVQVPAGNANLEVNQLSVDYTGPLGGADFGTALFIAATTTPTGSTAPTAGQEPRVTTDYNQIGA